MIPIFMYHQVAEIPGELDPLRLAVPPAQFERQMSYLARHGYSCLTLAEAVRHYRKGKRPPARSFVITFDDGFQDVHSRACPILEKFGFTATVFLVAGVMSSSSNWWGQDGTRSGRLLSQAEARDLARRGFILGSHTLSHPFLNLLDDQSALKEIRDSRALLQDQLDIPVDYFSYPFSATDARVEGLVKSAGYSAACAGDRGPWSVYNLWRVPCGRDDTSLSFALKARGGYFLRTALRESAPGQILRRSVHMFRRMLKIRPPSRLGDLNSGLDVEPERKP